MKQIADDLFNSLVIVFIISLIVGSSSFARFARSRRKQVSRESKCPIKIFVWEPHQKLKNRRKIGLKLLIPTTQRI
jgi:hypothetical protein